MSNSKGYKNRPESMYQPTKESDREREGQRNANYKGDGHDFNVKGKVTNPGGAYHDMTSGDGGNWSQKDSSISYLQDRNKKGQEVRNFKGTSEEAKMHTHNIGATAYNGKPIAETYKPATSHHEPPADAVIRPKKQKSEYC